MLVDVGTHLGPMVSHWLVLSSSFLDNDYFEVLLLLFHYQVHKGYVLNVGDVKDKAKCATRNTLPGFEILEHNSWHLNCVADTL